MIDKYELLEQADRLRSTSGPYGYATDPKDTALAMLLEAMAKMLWPGWMDVEKRLPTKSDEYPIAYPSYMQDPEGGVALVRNGEYELDIAWFNVGDGQWYLGDGVIPYNVDMPDIEFWYDTGRPRKENDVHIN